MRTRFGLKIATSLIEAHIFFKYNSGYKMRQCVVSFDASDVPNFNITFTYLTP